MSPADENQSIFQEILLEHGNHPRHARLPSLPDQLDESHNPHKGDRVRLGICWNEQGAIRNIGIEASGSTVLKASCSLMAETLLGRSRERALQEIDRFLAMLLDPQADAELEDWGDLAALSAIRRFPARVQCASMPWRLAQQMLQARAPGRVEKI